MGGIPHTPNRPPVYLHLMTSLLRLFEQLVSDPQAKAMFREAPERFLEDAGFGDLPVDDMAEALVHAADAFPPALANAIQPEFGLDRLVDIDLGSLGLGGFADFSSIWEPGEDLLGELGGDTFDVDSFLPDLSDALDGVGDALANLTDDVSDELGNLWDRLSGAEGDLDEDDFDEHDLNEEALVGDSLLDDPFASTNDTDSPLPTSDGDDDDDAAFDLDYDDEYNDLL